MRLYSNIKMSRKLKNQADIENARKHVQSEIDKLVNTGLDRESVHKIIANITERKSFKLKSIRSLDYGRRVWRIVNRLRKCRESS